MATLFFPLNAKRVKWNSQIEQSWDINEQETASGKRRTLTYQALPSWRFAIDFPMISAAEKDKLLEFYATCKGSMIPFFYKDSENYKCEKVILGRNQDGSYQLLSKIGHWQEAVEFADKITVYVDGTENTDYKLDRGAIVFTNKPAETAKVTASYEYYWKVCFAKSKISIKQKFNDFFECAIALKVVR